MTIFGTRVKQLRKSLQMTMEQLGGRIGVAKSTIAGYEKGFREPPIEKINLLALHLNTSVDYLFGLSEHVHLQAANNCYTDENLLNVKAFLDSTLLHWDNKLLHWDGIPLDEADLELIRNTLEKKCSQQS
jgi:transcriptional regulator with XRE-family HTH domain